MQRDASYDARLVEEAVAMAVRRLLPETRAAFHGDRDSVYDVKDPDEREVRFHRLHARWFARLGLGRPLETALAEQPVVTASVGGCDVLGATSRQQECADLWSGSGSAAGMRLVVRLRPASLAEPETLLPLLRHELMHVGDMLDPAFGYERSLPAADADVPENLLRDRYRVVWDVTIDGRLSHARLTDSARRAARFAEFARAFPRLGARAEEAFARWFDDPCPRHHAIVEFVFDAARGSDERENAPAS